MLRAALPQGEQASAKRAVRLTELGRRALDRQGSLLADAPRDPVLGALADAGGELPLARLFRLVPRARSPLPRMAEAGLVEMGDEVERRRPRADAGAGHRVAPSGDWDKALPRRAAVRRSTMAKIVAAGADGLPVASLTATERTHVRALSMAGLARVEHRPIRQGDGAGGAHHRAGGALAERRPRPRRWPRCAPRWAAGSPAFSCTA